MTSTITPAEIQSGSVALRQGDFDNHSLTDIFGVGINFEGERKFFDPEADQEDFLPPAPAEDSTYTADLVKVYLREMGDVPLLTRERELDLARRMERGWLLMQKASSRSALVQLMVVKLAERLNEGTQEIGNLVDLGDLTDLDLEEPHLRIANGAEN